MFGLIVFLSQENRLHSFLKQTKAIHSICNAIITSLPYTKFSQ